LILNYDFENRDPIIMREREREREMKTHRNKQIIHIWISKQNILTINFIHIYSRIISEVFEYFLLLISVFNLYI
jgi:ribosome maturation factor RimP